MIYFKSLYPILLLCLLISACNKRTTEVSENKENKEVKNGNTTTETTKDNAKALIGQWFVTNFPMDGKPVAPKTFYSLTFDGESIGLKLDINSCGVGYTATNDEITFDGMMSCTEACCDSKEAQALSSLLSGKAKYILGSNILTISTNSGDVKLKNGLDGIKGRNWVALSYADRKEGQHIKFGKKYSLIFEPTAIRLVLDANACTANCTYFDRELSFELPSTNMGCTRKCCDSDDGVALMEMLKGKISYKLDNIKGTLTLKTFNKEIIFRTESSKDED